MYNPCKKWSKRIVNKNIVKLEGIHFIDHTVKLCNSCNFIDRAFISTDSKAIAKEHQEKCQVLRPKHLCEDNSTDIGYLNHFLNGFSEYNTYPTWLILMRPTSPFRHKSLVEKIFVCIAKKIPKNGLQNTNKNFAPMAQLKRVTMVLLSYIKNGFTVRSQELRDTFTQWDFRHYLCEGFSWTQFGIW